MFSAFSSLPKLFSSPADDGEEVATPVSPDPLNVSGKMLDDLENLLKKEVGQDGLIPSRNFLTKCIVFNRLNLDVAKKTAVEFMEFRKSTGWPLKIEQSSVETAAQTGVHWVIPRRPTDLPENAWSGDPNSNDAGPAACVVMNVSAMDLALTSMHEYQRLSAFIAECVTDDPEVQRRGIALVIDFNGAKSSTLSRLSVQDLRRGIRGVFPCRLRRVWLVDAPSTLRIVLGTALSFLPRKMRQRVGQDSRKTNLEKISKDLGQLFGLPKELGGVDGYDWGRVWSSITCEAPQKKNTIVQNIYDNISECSTAESSENGQQEPQIVSERILVSL